MLPVSVIIPNFNNGSYIERCLRSVSEGPGSVPEVIVFDNASTDDSLAIVERLGLANVRIIRHHENLGAARGRHAAIAHARYDLLCFLDGDDFLSEGAVAAACQQLLQDQLDMSLFNMLRTNQQATEVSPFIASPRQLLDGSRAFSLTLGQWQIHPMGVMRRSLYDRAVAGFDLEGFATDELLTRRLFLHADRIHGNEGCYYYRQVQKPASLTRVLGQTRTEVAVLQLAADNAHRLDDIGLLCDARNLALRSLRRAIRAASGHPQEISKLVDIYRQAVSARVGWRLRDARYLLWRLMLPLQLKLLRLRARVSGSGTTE